MCDDGVRVSFRVEGDGKPLVFIHGWAASSNYWKYQIDHFSKSYKVIAPDLRGHGDSDKPLDADYSVERMAKDILTIIDKLSLKDVILVGHSLGGLIVLELLRKFRDISGITLVSTPYKETVPVFPVMLLLRWRWLAEKIITPRLVGPDANEELLNFMRRESAKSKPEILRRVFKEVAKYTPAIDKLGIKGISVVGEYDRTINKRRVKEISDILGLKFLMIKRAGHNLMLEKPSEFNIALEQFLDSLKSSS